MTAFLVAFALQVTVSATAIQSVPQVTLKVGVNACKTIDEDQNLAAIVGEVFKNKPIELVEAGKISKSFFDSVSRAEFYICNDRLWDAMLLPGEPPRVVFDRSMLTLLYMESQSLIVGQYLANDNQVRDALGLHGSLMKYIAAQNLDRQVPLISFQSLVDGLVGKPVDLDKYLSNDKAKVQTQTQYLNSLYFLIFHEFCHIDADRHPSGDRQGSQDRSESDAAANQREIDADRCAVDIINRDEALRQSPISFLSVFLVAATQGVLENVLRPSGQVLGHPASSDRLRKAHALATGFIASSPNRIKFQATLDGVLEHFLSVLPK